MSNAKSTQARAAKRNARSKAKASSATKARQAPAAVQKKKFKAAMKKHGLNNMSFDQVLGNAVRDVNNRKKVEESDIKSIDDVLTGLSKSTTEVFRLYSYITFAEAMAEKGLFEYAPTINLDEISLSLMSIDSRVSVMKQLDQVEQEDEIFTEALDLSVIISNHSEELYAEVTLLETKAIEIEETLTKLASEEEGKDINVARAEVLQSIAYKRLADVYMKNKKETEETPAAPEEPSSEVVA
jgi:flagellar hook-basal body complex protein FliE